MTEPKVQVDICWARVPDDAAQMLSPFLSAAERDRMARFHFGRDRAAYATAHGLLRQILGQYLPEVYLGDFVLGKHGKPALPSPGLLQFNLSHAHDMVAVVVSSSAPVGVDLEALFRPLDARALAASVLSVQEAAELKASGWSNDVFLARWVAKEALAKAAGFGLQADFRQICLAGEPLEIVDLPPDFGPDKAWSLSQRVVKDHVVCAAARGEDVLWKWRECDFDKSDGFRTRLPNMNT